jgi:hypothetical protein
MMKVLSTLHSALFGYESALVDLIGSRGYKTHVFPKIVETIKKIKDEDPLIAELLKSTSAKEAMGKWLEVLKLCGITKNGEIIDRGNDEYEIKIPDCSMCNPIHEIMGDQKGICPMALIMAASSSIGDDAKVPEMSYSTIHPTGTATELKFTSE